MIPIMQIHGWSSGPLVWDRVGLNATRPTFSEVDTVDGFMDTVRAALPTDPAIVVGWSMGGMLALQLALAHPNRVRGLVLVGTSPAFTSTDRTTGWPKRAVQRMQRALNKDADATLAQFRKAMFTDNEDAAESDFFGAFDSPGNMDFSQAGLSAGLDYLMDFDVANTLNDIPCPALWIHGAQDAICPVGCLGAVPDHHGKTIIPDTGHAPHWSRPDRIRQEIAEFIDGQ